EDIPEKVLEYFNESYNFLSELVGKENVVYAGVHFDEDTPHMHFYFLPVVNQVKRKVFQTDENGKRITKQIFSKNKTIKNVPIQLKDKDGNNIYEIEYGNFLNSDEFWRQHGGKSSFARIQDQYNEYMKSKGIELDRGNVGANKHHQDKAEYNLKVLQHQIEDLKQELEKTKSMNDIELKTSNDIKNINDEDIFNPSKDFLKRYKDKDVEELINYSKELKKENLSAIKESDKKSIEIEKLKNQVSQFKSGKTYQDKEKAIANQERIIEEQEKIIKEKDTIIESLKTQLSSLRERFQIVFEDIHEKLNKAYLAVAHLLGFKDIDKYHVDHNLMEYKVQEINRKYEPKNKKTEKEKTDDYEL
ncbi:MAG: plasmid recombination protein, partial [Bacilli bacterium]|nr:plasmid recombination protein [Bacilli bacterium]